MYRESDPSSGQRVGTLRGAGVEADSRRVGVVLIVVCLIGLAVAAVVFFVAAEQKNAQDNNLRQHGFTVAVTVSGCKALLAGSGSNGDGYTCQGTFSAGGHRYDETLPNDALYGRGAIVRDVTDSADPGLLATPHAVATERASWRAYILPVSLLIVLAVLVEFFALRRRHARRGLERGDKPTPVQGTAA